MTVQPKRALKALTPIRIRTLLRLRALRERWCTITRLSRRDTCPPSTNSYLSSKSYSKTKMYMPTTEWTTSRTVSLWPPQPPLNLTPKPSMFLYRGSLTPPQPGNNLFTNSGVVLCMTKPNHIPSRPKHPPSLTFNLKSYWTLPKRFTLELRLNLLRTRCYSRKKITNISSKLSKSIFWASRRE